jgi:outer membrane murein-binding lipoprotein Lpp
MNKNQIIVTVMLLIIGTILIAGCTFPADSENHTNNVSLNVTTFTAAATSLQTQCPQSGNSTPWIIINPVGNHYLGDVFEINGTTNVGINKKILYHIGRPPIPMPTGAPSPNLTVTDGLAKIMDNGCNEQRWSFLLNTSGFESWSNSYFVGVMTEDRKEPNSAFNTTYIHLYPQGSNKVRGD